MKPDLITWIASYPKSGSTWVRLLINGYFTGKVDINAMSYCLGDQDRYFHQSLSPRGQLTQAETSLVRPAALLHMLAAVPHRPLFVKTHNANCDIDGIMAQPTGVTSCAIYCVRDPRDIVLSQANHFGTTIDESITALNDSTRAIGDDQAYLHYLGSWSDHVRSWTGGESAYPIIGVKYEKLLADPEGVFFRMLEKIGIEPDYAKITEAVRLSAFQRLQEQEARKGFAEKPDKSKVFFRKGKSTWREELTEEQINRIEVAHQDMMRRHGYDPVTLQDRNSRGRDGDGPVSGTQPDHPARRAS